MEVVCHLWTWHLSVYHPVDWVFSWPTSQSTFMSHVTPLSLSKECIVHYHIVCLSGLVMLPSISSCRPMFKGRKKFSSAVKIAFVSVPFESILWLRHLQHSITLFWVSCFRCGIHHGSPSTRQFLSTSAHHPQISFRNEFNTLRSVCLNDRFSHSRHRFT